ncbi:pyridine nucleotide-disulfide oxidoreductase [Streptomyces albulus]|nr:pyridine nucleotide-disulfide oxidoreductase [Streptomyces noursei]
MVPSENGPLRPGRSARTQHVFTCSRDLLDRVVRGQVPALSGVSVLDGTEAERLTGTAEHVTGVWVRGTTSGETYRLDADLVVDATGRSSTTPDRLAALGLPAAPEDVRDSGIVCATRIFRAPAGARNCPVITGRSDCRPPADAAAHGTRSARPDRDAGPDRGRALAGHAHRWRQRRRTAVRTRRPLRAVRAPHPPGHQGPHRRGRAAERGAADPDTSSRRHRYERLRSWPTGFLALGGAVASVNPDFGQGLSLAAHGAAELRAALGRYGLDEPALARRVQRAVGGLVDGPWALAAGEASALPAPGRLPAVAGHPFRARRARRSARPGRRPASGLPRLRGRGPAGRPGDPAAAGVDPATGVRRALVRGARRAPKPRTRRPRCRPGTPFGHRRAHHGAGPGRTERTRPGRALRRLPRSLGFGPASLRLGRFSAGRRKPGTPEARPWTGHGIAVKYGGCRAHVRSPVADRRRRHHQGVANNGEAR